MELMSEVGTASSACGSRSRSLAWSWWYRTRSKVPRSRRWRVSLGGRRLMASAIKLREVAFPKLFALAA
jgi:hypothetical protein